MIPGLIQIEDFLKNVDEIRDQALNLKYTPAFEEQGWKGYRCLERNELTTKVTELVKAELSKRDDKFTTADYDCYFHYTLQNTVKEKGYYKNRIHKDRLKDYAGVIYLATNPISNSGTAFYDENYIQVAESKNKYNTLVCYPANVNHGIQEPFGDSKENGRLTFTIFIGFKQKQSKTLI